MEFIQLEIPDDPCVEEGLAPYVISSSKKCEICGLLFLAEDYIITLNCEHVFNKSCIAKYEYSTCSNFRHIYTMYKNRSHINQIKCPIYNCRKPIGFETIEFIVGREIAQQISLRTLVSDIKYFKCPVCNYTYLTEENTRKDIQCCSCGTNICMICKQVGHEGRCLTRIKDIRFLKELGLIVMPCPYCLQLFSHDKQCDHVLCLNCQNTFCFGCSAKRNPILNHGNHYHRPNCKHYYPWQENEINLKCLECKALKFEKACSRPKDLEEGDIPEEEILALLS